MPSEIRFPFAVAPDGAIAAVADPDQQVRQRVYSLIGTEPGERVMLTEYGIETRAALFEPDDEGVADLIADMTRDQMEMYEPGVLVQSVSAVESVPGSGESSVLVNYIRREAPTTPEDLATQSNIAIIGVGGAVDEVVRG